jgi:SHAQKYF class myb-like DNA-binding protein
VATPKQIRELMKVDGLTNDEVKSHLQVSLAPSPNLP